uniref:Carrier domain-containing protein n=1 Tax=Rhodnius prolixus TaxID=13249 RepID=T1H7Z0_RHOPR
MVQQKEHDDCLEAGRRLATVSLEDEVVISGLAGVYPDSDNVTDFANKLFNKVDLISDDDRRWKLDHPEIPQRTGKLKEIRKFDASFFNLHYNQAQSMDPMCRLLLERTYEAVVDAGPSYAIDTACSSGMYALEQGYKAIRTGQCNSAVVAACNLCLHPYVSLQFSRLGVLSMDGKCKVFDEAANGYCRSEAACVLYLQRRADAKRIYATIVHAKTNCDGYKEEGITYPSGQAQEQLLIDFYKECDIDPSSLAWIEAHGTGTKVGDPEELNAIVNVICKGRKTPLKIGSVKSNIGHSEPVSGLCSITKVIIAMETGLIPPNINFHTPRKDIEALHNKTVQTEFFHSQVVTEPTKWDGGMVGVNSFGFGGANCHSLLKWNEKSKVNNGLPEDNLPRLVNFSGRTYDAVMSALTHMEEMPLDREFVKLLHDIHAHEIPAHLYRGYAILSKDKSISCKNVKKQWGERELTLNLPGLFTNLEPLDSSLLEIPCIKTLLEELSTYIKTDLVRLLRGQSQENDSLIVIFLKITALQICLITLLKKLDVKILKVTGSSIGQIGCAFADGIINAKEAILLSYFTALGIIESKPSPGLVLIAGTTVKKLGQIQEQLNVYSNGERNCLITGPKDLVIKLKNKLLTNGINSEIIKTANIALHHQTLNVAQRKISSHLQKVLLDSRQSSTKWLNQSISYEYFSKMTCDKFEDHFNELCDNEPILQLGPPCKLFKSSQPLTGIYLLEKTNDNFNQITALLDNLGRLYTEGVSFDVGNLYPPVEFPVSRSTQMISPLVQWDHSDEWYVPSYRTQKMIKAGERNINISLKEEELEYIAGHVVDGRNLFPATGYLWLVWETVSMLRGETFHEVPIVFENVRFHRATNLSKDGSIDFIVIVQKVSGKFEVVEGGAAIVTGTTYVPQDVSSEMIELQERCPPSEYPMSANDIYKELRLRGYQYKGLFRALNKLNMDESCAKIVWSNNWVTFMDNMLQMKIIFEETRGLFVPTAIERLTIDPKKHLQICNQLASDDKEIVAEMLTWYYRELDLIKSGGIELRGMQANAIARRKNLSEPVLEKYVFTPYHESEEVYSLEQIVRILVQLILENEELNNTIKVVEFAAHPIKLLAPIVAQVLSDLPLIQPDITVQSSSTNPQITDLPPEIIVEEKKLPANKAALIAVASNLLETDRAEVLQNCLNSLKDSGFIITTEDIGTEFKMNDLITVASYNCNNKCIILLRKLVIVDFKFITTIYKMQGSLRNVQNDEIIKYDSDDFAWVPKAQKLLSTIENKKVIFFSEKQKHSGLLGFYNCLNKETDNRKARCVLIMDNNAEKFSITSTFYSDQLSKDLAINIYKNGKWGSYRHFLIDSSNIIKTQNAYVNFTTRGDLSSLTWFNGNFSKSQLTEDTKFAYTEYCSLNFRDVMLATNKLAPEVISKGRLDQDCVIGFEFSGYLDDGTRVMGFLEKSGLASKVLLNKDFHWIVPDDISLEEAATIPVVYATVVYSFFLNGGLKKEDSVLIHSGTGGVGQAAINIALHTGCRVFTTVGTPEKREFIRKKFPQIPDEDIGNSRDISFERMIMKRTNGRGVDVVLNSLAEEKLFASVRCLAKGGRFLEIGKFDFSNNSQLGMEMFRKGASFHGIMLDNIYDAPMETRIQLTTVMDEYLKQGVLKPLERTIFNRNQVEQAFRYMAGGKHIGKVLIKINDPPPEKIGKFAALYDAKGKFYCKDDMTYIIAGGLGGFGVELADWLVLRGCRKLLISSRRGLTEGYQMLRIDIWKSYGAVVEISTEDITTEQGVKNLLNTAIKMGAVAGIFNLAVVLSDALFENQTEETFKISAGPKAIATTLLDKYSRELCPNLENFVIFSSVSCGRGNIGQTNYGQSNSVMERIMESRKEDNLPALAIQWGAVGDVGLVAKMNDQKIDVVIGGTLQQPIANCLQMMDIFLNQSDAIVSSIVVAEKKSLSSANNIVDTVVNILVRVNSFSNVRREVIFNQSVHYSNVPDSVKRLVDVHQNHDSVLALIKGLGGIVYNSGLSDLKNVSQHSTLAEIGMDSMMAVEIKQTLEREFEVFLSPQDIRSMTFAKLHEISSSKEAGVPAEIITDKSAANLFDIGLLITLIGDEPEKFEPCVKLSSAIPKDVFCPHKLFTIPGIEGVNAIMETICKEIEAQTYGLQFDYTRSVDTVQDVADHLLPVSRIKFS